MVRVSVLVMDLFKIIRMRFITTNVSCAHQTRRMQSLTAIPFYLIFTTMKFLHLAIHHLRCVANLTLSGNNPRAQIQGLAFLIGHKTLLRY